MENLEVMKNSNLENEFFMALDTLLLYALELFSEYGVFEFQKLYCIDFQVITKKTIETKKVTKY